MTREYKIGEEWRNDYGDRRQVIDMWGPIPHYECATIQTHCCNTGTVSQETIMRRMDAHPDGPTDWWRT